MLFHTFKQNFLWLSLCPLPLVLSEDTTEETLAVAQLPTAAVPLHAGVSLGSEQALARYGP